MRFTLITERRRHAPRGRDGGGDGEPGRNLLNGEPLPGKAEGELEPGDRLRIETPGGGGRFGLKHVVQFCDFGVPRLESAISGRAADGLFTACQTPPRSPQFDIPPTLRV